MENTATFQLNRSYKSKDIIFGNFFGISAGFFYSLSPLFIFFFTVDPSTAFIFAFIIAIFQEFMSWILTVFLYGFEKGIKRFKEKDKLFVILIFSGIGILIFAFIYGIIKSIKDLVGNMRYKSSWIMMFVGLLSGPISMAFLMVAIPFLNNSSELSNSILNTAPIYCLLAARILFKDKLTNVSLVAILFTTLFTVGMILNYIFVSDINITNLFIGMALGLAGALLYALEGVVGDYLINTKKVHALTTKELITLKGFTGTILMLVIVTPLASLIDGQNITFGWNVLGKTFGSKPVEVIMLFLAGMANAVARVFFYKSVKKTNGTFTLSALLTMLLWTPILQMIGNAFLSDINISAIPWFYWIWATLIFAGLTVLTFSSYIQKYLDSKFKKPIPDIEKKKNKAVKYNNFILYLCTIY
ncbi:hypothetical protein NPX79_03120 [Spiroplasma endosymbiont of Anurida maritima]|uniref:hypothetical protein n=1 Tax=Spiroplasma endosymbiont of Anurida maritima TaxID=2967972 RepID=UPI0036D2BD08